MAGRPVIITEAPPEEGPADDVLVVRVDEDAEVVRALDALERAPTLVRLHLFHADPTHVWNVLCAAHVFVAAAGGAVSDEQGRLLVIRRLGLWDLPKGKVDPGEGMEAAAVREVQEETGLRSVRITAPLPGSWHTYERKGRRYLKHTHWYVMEASSAEVLVPQTEEDIEEVRWIEPAELAGIKKRTYPSLVAVINAWEAARPRP